MSGPVFCSYAKWGEKEFNVDQYEEALAEVQQIEEQMYGIANIVRETPNDELSHLRYVHVSLDNKSSTTL